MRRALVLPLLLALALPGCLSISVAHVPDRLLEGANGNGWGVNRTASQSEPTSSSMGTQKAQTLVYDAPAPSQGYPGVLSVTTVRGLLSQSEEKTRALVQERIRDQSTKDGITFSGEPTQGKRTLANGAESLWFVYSGTVSNSGFFSRNADVKVYGEVFQCAAQKTTVAIVGLAQTSDTRNVGGVGLPPNQDDSTWRAIAGDPSGAIESIRNSDGLAYNVAC